MKKLLLLAAIAIPSSLFAQSMALVKMDKVSPYAEKDPADICFLSETYQQISDEMFKAGNPKYIWVDLMKDGYIEDGDGLCYNLYVYTTGKTEKGNVEIPDAVQQAYTTKWLLFVASLHEKPDRDWYNQHMWQGVNAKDIVNPASDFRKTNKIELSRMHLNTRGNIRLYEELLKDGLVTLDKPASYDFGLNGYIVNNIRLSPELADKYKAILKEEFGYENKGSRSFRMQSGPLPDHTLALELERLYNRIEK